MRNPPGAGTRGPRGRRAAGGAAAGPSRAVPSRAAGLPSGLALMKTRTLLPLGTRWAGSAARLPAKAARRSAASRGQGSLPPAPAAHMAPRRRAHGSPRPVLLLLLLMLAAAMRPLRCLLLGGGEKVWRPSPAAAARLVPAGWAAGSPAEPALLRALQGPRAGFL